MTLLEVVAQSDLGGGAVRLFGNSQDTSLDRIPYPERAIRFGDHPFISAVATKARCCSPAKSRIWFAWG